MNTEPQINGRFKPDDFKDVVGLASKLRAGTTPIDKYLVGRLSAAGVDAVAKAAEPEADLNALKSAFATELNRICDGELIYDEIRFAAIERRRSTRRLLGKNPQGPALFRLNKLLLEDAFLAEIYRQKGRGRNAVQKPATVHYFKKSNVWGVLVNLVTPRELEGKMRSGRVKFEKQTQDLANALCAEINAKLFGLELARQLNQREMDIAKKLFWELLEPKHPDWIDHMDKMVDHCERSDFRVDQTDIPNIIGAAKMYWAKHIMGLEPETQIGYRDTFGFLFPRFGMLKPNQMTDEMVMKMAEGEDPLDFWQTSRKWKPTAEEDEARRWDTPTKSKSKRPWNYFMKMKFLMYVRAFKTWMHSSKDPIMQKRRNWCPPCEIEIPKPPKTVPVKAGKKQGAEEILNAECQKNPALTIPQCQALLDVAFIAFNGRYAAFFVHALFGGTRIKETRRMGAKGFDPEDGVQSVSEEAAKTDQARESALYDNLIIMVEALKSVGLYKDENLRPCSQTRAVIHILAGFTSNCKAALKRANKERKRVAASGRVLPPDNWGIALPRNAARRTSLSMHYKLFGSEALTVQWAGNSEAVFKPFYKRLVSKADARQFWVLLPALLKASGDVKVNLPAHHRLDSAMTKEVAAAIPIASQAMSLAVGKLAAARTVELEQRRITHNKRLSEIYKVEKLTARQNEGPAAADSLPKAA